MQAQVFVVFLCPSRHITGLCLNYITAASFHIFSNSLFAYHPSILEFCYSLSYWERR
jgi:hypothetical protein